MKKSRVAKICMAVCLVIGLTIMPTNQFEVQAAEVIATVQGTVMSGTTSELLKLSTKEGNMEIKLDSGTDTSDYKILLPNKKISVSVSNGSDGYLHAVKITNTTKAPASGIDSSNISNVSGTLGEKSSDELIYLNTSQGEMQIKLDTTTNMSGCSVLVMGKTYYVSCARGSDAFMHAISISDTITTTPPSGNYNGSTTSVTGTVSDKTKDDLLYLSTSGGEMQFVIDSNSDTSRGMVLTPGNKMTVSFYRGSDAYLHAASIVGVKDSLAAVQIDTSSPSTVTGTVGSKSNENILYLNTSGGDMELKLDAVSSVTNCKALVSGKKITVSCARGSDAYMHALTITGTTGLTTTPPSGNNVATASVTGTVVDKTKENILYLSTSGGEMQFVIDSNADTSKGMVLTSGNKLTVSFYHGSDGYLHATSIVGVKDGTQAKIDTSSPSTVTGTVDSKSNENILYLNTSGGVMELKLDAVGSVSNCKVLISGKKITVTCARGDDAYMHATSITGN